MPFHLDVVLRHKAFEHSNIYKDQRYDSGVNIDTLGKAFQIAGRPSGYENKIKAEYTGDKCEHAPTARNDLHQHAKGLPKKTPFQIDDGKIEYTHQKDIDKRGESEALCQPADHGGRQCRQHDLRCVVEYRLCGCVVSCPVCEKSSRKGNGEKKQTEQQQFSAYL